MHAEVACDPAVRAHDVFKSSHAYLSFESSWDSMMLSRTRQDIFSSLSASAQSGAHAHTMGARWAQAESHGHDAPSQLSTCPATCTKWYETVQNGAKQYTMGIDGVACHGAVAVKGETILPTSKRESMRRMERRWHTHETFLETDRCGMRCGACPCLRSGSMLGLFV